MGLISSRFFGISSFSNLIVAVLASTFVHGGGHSLSFLERSDGAIGGGIGFGTLGAGASVAVSFDKYVGFRVNANVLRFGLPEKKPFGNVKRHIRNIGFLSDFTPFGEGPFISNVRVTTGLYANQFFIDAYSSGKNITRYVKDNAPAGSQAAIILDDTIDSANIEIDFGSLISPYFGVGYGRFADNRQKGFDIYFDIGAIYVGKAKSKYNLNFKNNLESELFKSEVRDIVTDKVKEIQKDFSDQYSRKLYPVLGIGIIYRY